MHTSLRPLVQTSVLIGLLAGCSAPVPGTTTSPSAAPTSPSSGPPTSSPASPALPTASPAPTGTQPAPFVFVPAGPPPTDLGLSATTERDGVRVAVELERAPLEVGVPSQVTVTVRNVGTRDVRWLTDGCGSPVDVYAVLVGENWIGGQAQRGIRAEFKTFALEPFGHSGSSPLTVGFEDLDSKVPDGAGCADMGFGFELAAGKSLTRHLEWSGGTVIAPDGPVEVVASFRYNGHVGEDVDERYEPIAARLPSWLVSGYEPPFMPPGPAIDAALADPTFATWLEEAPASTWTNTHRGFSPDRWTIGLFRDPEHGFYGEVTLDAKTGAVVGHRFE